ncbi:MAG TPA: tetratricopeptide repeat protein [Rudaea sp.]|jgi:TolB-like protein|nr:tetratricopeptide repeat protein [Rudaea sp.]
MSVFTELKRRNVIRAAVLYIGAVWALAQGIAQLGPFFGMPDWGVRWFVIAAAIGFPFWIAFAWVYEWTPKGLKRESEIAVDAAIARAAGRRMDRAIIAVLAVAVVLLLTNAFVSRKSTGSQKNVPTPTTGTSTAIPAKSIAVLPFVNMSGDAKEDYFSDGITEEILNALAQVPDLKVAGRTSAFAFKGKAEDLRKIGEALDVATVLEGSVQKSGDAVRITAQLIDARSGYHLWSDKYDRKLDNVFAVEDEISKAIADTMRVQLSGGGKVTLVAQEGIDPQAHDFYLRGLAEYAQRGPSLLDAVASFQKALAIAPDYADAWAALAEANAQLPNYGLGEVSTAMSAAEASALQALKINPSNAAAYVALGVVYLNRGQWAQADEALRQAMRLAPGDAEAIHQHAYFLLVSGNPELALNELDRAIAIDPLSPVMNAGRGEILFYLHRYEAAWAQVQASIAHYPDFALAYFFAIPVAGVTGHTTELLAYARREAELGGESPDVAAQIALGVADPTQRAHALRVLAGQPDSPVFDPYARINWYCLLGEPAKAIDVLDSAMRAGRNPAFSAEAAGSPLFDPVRNDPRFKAALKTMGLPYVPTSKTGRD